MAVVFLPLRPFALVVGHGDRGVKTAAADIPAWFSARNAWTTHGDHAPSFRGDPVSHAGMVPP